MIPLQLTIKNFLSYGPETQTIDFAPHHLICLSGKNGHGKSALLDALTWVLWGQARKTLGTAKADPGLIRLGQTQMMVSLDFECNGQTYRVKREFAITYGKPYSTLEFGVLDVQKNSCIPLTDKTIRTSQAKIIDTIHLDYESFINSAFLRQGQSHEFSKKSPKERKEVLATILGLTRYETVRKLASDKTRQATADKHLLEAIAQKNELELAKKEALANQIIELDAQLAQLKKEEDQLTQTKNVWNNHVKELGQKQHDASLLSHSLNQEKEKAQKLEQQLKTDFAKWRMVNRQLQSINDYEQLQIHKKELSEKVAHHQSLQQKYLEQKEHALKEQEILARIEHEIKTERSQQLHRLELELERMTLTTAQVQQKEIALAKQCSQFIAQKEQLLKEREFLEKQFVAGIEPSLLAALEKQFDKRKEYYQKWVAQGNLLTTQRNSMLKKNSLVDHDDTPSCPLCEQNLTAARRRFLKKKFEIDQAFYTHRLERIARLVKTLKSVLVEQHAQIERYKKQTQENALKEQEITQITSQIACLEQALEQTQHLHNCQQILLITSQEELSKSQSVYTQTVQKNKDSHTSDIRYTSQEAQLAIRNTQIQEIGYDQALHQQCQKEFIALEQKLTHYLNPQQAKESQEQLKNHIMQIITQLRNSKKERAHLQEQLKAFINLDELQASLEHTHSQITQGFTHLTSVKEQLLQQKGSCHEQERALQECERHQKEHQKKIAELTQVIEDFQAIAQALSKDGVQALLIEDIIPEIEHEANALLSQLTDNQTHLFIESLKDLKKGGSKETLDIKISDAAGIRPYEMFSGGEAFRIDFALRIAISKLLARRSGTTLQTLIIDEGFGSQDEEGLGHIMDTIYKIQEHFAKVIIVSHLPSMKDQFPVHIVVEKKPQGSVVSVIEQG